MSGARAIQAAVWSALMLAACAAPTFAPEAGAEQGACDDWLDNDLDGATDLDDADCWDDAALEVRPCPVVAGTGDGPAPRRLLDAPGAWRGDATVAPEDPEGRLAGPVLLVPSGCVARLDDALTGAVPGTRLRGVIDGDPIAARLVLASAQASGPRRAQVALRFDPGLEPMPEPNSGDLPARSVPPGPIAFELEITTREVRVAPSSGRTDRRDLPVDFEPIAPLALEVRAVDGAGAVRLAGLEAHRPPGFACADAPEPPPATRASPGAVEAVAVAGETVCALVRRPARVLEAWRSDDGGRRYLLADAVELPDALLGADLAAGCDGGFGGIALVGEVDTPRAVGLASPACEVLEVVGATGVPAWPAGARPESVSVMPADDAPCDEPPALTVFVPQDCDGVPALSRHRWDATGWSPLGTCGLLELASSVDALLGSLTEARPLPFAGEDVQVIRAGGTLLLAGPSARGDGTHALLRPVAASDEAELRARFARASETVRAVYAAGRGGRGLDAVAFLLEPVRDPWIGPSARLGAPDRVGVGRARVAFSAPPAEPFAPETGGGAWGAALYEGLPVDGLAPAGLSTALLRARPPAAE